MPKATSTRRRWGAIFAGLCALSLIGAQTLSAQQGAATSEPALAAFVSIKGEINGFTGRAFEVALSESLARRPKVVVIELDTPGGWVDTADEIATNVARLVDSGTEVIAWVRNEAISAGALIALSCSKITMARGSQIGDALPIQIGMDDFFKLDIRVAEKVLAPWRGSFESYADQRGYPIALARAMVDPTHDGILQVTTRVGGREAHQFLSQSEFEQLSRADRSGVAESRLILEKGRILVMNDNQAQSWGFSWRSNINSRAELCAELATAFGVSSVEPYEMSNLWWLEVLRFINNGWIKALLFIVGGVSLLVAIKTPGTGVAEVLTVLCFLAVFGGSYMVGLAGVIEIAVFVLGAALLATEIFLIPGFGVTGGLGILCILASFMLTLQRFVLPETQGDWVVFKYNLLITSLTLIGAVLALGLAIRFLPKTALLRGLMHEDQQESANNEQIAGSSVTGGLLVGRVGTVATALRPSGQVQLGEDIVDAVSEEAFLDKGTSVEVIGRRGFSVLVRKLPAALTNNPDGLYLEHDSQAGD